MMTRRGPVAAVVPAPEFAAMIESIILRCICSASFALAIESRIFAVSILLRTASAIRSESSRETVGLGGLSGAMPLASAARLTTLSAGLFVERFFCRYMCPLGAALAIPGRIRMFEWLRRWPECGSPCQRCANDCPVQAIHPEGHINVNECIYCMHCQELYFDDHRCPHMIQVRLKREKRDALSSPSMRSGKAPKTIITAGGKPIGLPPVDAVTPPST